eukprot:CAMPEP_0170468132 /NCGR_PEP_ID=MMETSP0123-20130129/11429_1 /TAXON_ID=182087 /ORGANISM="Favella ehrenbergii, Strain Fehren 1" /LENGTH=275 /DNA_ID=CAMNT_0010734629 /DNA_START=6 /DNA_END=833 /DNA_ORIENTATION=+
MIKIGAIAASLKSKDKAKKPRKRSPSEEEVEMLKKQEHTEIQDIDIRENSKQKLRFRKMPWLELLFTILFWGGAIAVFICMHYYKDRLKKSYTIFYIPIGILFFLGFMAFKEMRFESICLDKTNNTIEIKRYIMAKLDVKLTYAKVDQVVQVYAARKGVSKKAENFTHFNVMLRLSNGQRMRLLESSNAKRVRKEVLLLRKFCGVDVEGEVPIYDEVRTTDGDKKVSRYQGAPKRRQIVSSSGEKLVDDSESEIELATLDTEKVVAEDENTLKED